MTVVIPARNAGCVLADQLNALLCQSVIPAEVIVVNNRSADNTVEIAQNFVALFVPEGILRVENCLTIGVNNARNAGISKASFEKILICDADDLAHHNWVENMSKCLDDHPLVSGATFPFSDRTSTNDPSAIFVETEPVLPKRSSTLGGIQTGIGCNIGLHKGLWELLGGFDSRINGSLDENEFVYRSAARGVPLYLCPSSKMAYFRNASIKKQFLRSFQHGKNTTFIKRLNPTPSPLNNTATLTSENQQICSKYQLRHFGIKRTMRKLLLLLGSFYGSLKRIH